MAKCAYLIFNVMAVLTGILLLHKEKLRVHWRSLVVAYLLVSLPFIAWDILATKAGHWGFNPAYVTGIRLFGIPIEEMLFFFAVPFVCLSVYLVCKKYVRGEMALANKILLSSFGLLATIMIILSVGGKYTTIVAVALLISAVVGGVFSRVSNRKAFWLAMLLNFGLFFLANTFLTALPIVTYSVSAITGIRIGTIPIEDFAYNFALLALFLTVYDIENSK